MTVAEIPADELVEMTPLLHRAFQAGGCSPICHCCCKAIKPSSNFWLATVDTHKRPEKTSFGGIGIHKTQETREVMLCADCDIAKMNAMTAEDRKRYEDWQAKGGGCHRVNGQIVH